MTIKNQYGKWDPPQRERFLEGERKKQDPIKPRHGVGVDIDGTLYSGAGTDEPPTEFKYPPAPGAIEWLKATIKEYDVYIHSSRCNTVEGRMAIREWLKANGITLQDLSYIHIIADKPSAAKLFVDDRSYAFDGSNWPTVEQIKAWKPWWNKDGNKDEKA